MVSALLALLLLAAAVPPLRAAPVQVQVSDEAGRPLADAVVFLESRAAREAARPLPRVEVSQAERRFQPEVSIVTVGTAVSFPNRDTVRHHVYSFSPAKKFEMKIDKGFVMAMERSEGDRKIVRSTIDLAHNLGLSVVAEGVEDEAVLGRLAALGCDEAQGYHLSRPLAAEAFEAWAREAGEALEALEARARLEHRAAHPDLQRLAAPRAV